MRMCVCVHVCAVYVHVCCAVYTLCIRCLHCNMLLTVDQEDKLPCSSKRYKDSSLPLLAVARCFREQCHVHASRHFSLPPDCRVSVSAEGEIVYLHQVDPQWDVNSYLALLLANGRTIREVYWM